MILFILGLRRSGTTVFWRIFRQDQRFMCYDEPFNPLHQQIPARHFKQTRDELIEVYKYDSDKFRDCFDPIDPEEELSRNFNRSQQEYLDHLTTYGDKSHYAIDLTRCHFRIKHLYRLFPDSYVIHLHKSPASFASSHLVPSYKRLPHLNRKAKRLLDRLFFFSRRTNFNRWKMEDILGRNEEGPFPSHVLTDASYRKTFGQAPAVSKLMAYWDYQYRQVEKHGKSCFGTRFYSLRFEDFCQHTESIIKEIYEWMNISYQPLQLNHVKMPNSTYKPGDQRWYRRASEVRLQNTDSYLFRSKVS